MDSPFFPIISVFLISLIVFFIAFKLLWIKHGRNQIIEAIEKREGPLKIRTELGSWPWLTAFASSLAMVVVLVAISWMYFGEWLDPERYFGSFKYKIADFFFKDFFKKDLTSSGTTNPFIALGCVVSLFFGVFLGALFGKKRGAKLAARKFHITSSLL